MFTFQNLTLFLLAFAFMEFVAWFVHKYIMHGFLWVLHRDHHTGAKGIFQRNDFFFLIFAIPSIILIFCGMLGSAYGFAAFGFGIALYGLAYFIVHEVFIHQRLKWFRETKNKYLKAVRKAHKMHHSHITKEGGESFGMLTFSFRYYQMANSLEKKIK